MDTGVLEARRTCALDGAHTFKIFEGSVDREELKEPVYLIRKLYNFNKIGLISYCQNGFEFAVYP